MGCEGEQSRDKTQKKKKKLFGSDSTCYSLYVHEFHEFRRYDTIPFANRACHGVALDDGSVRVRADCTRAPHSGA